MMRIPRRRRGFERAGEVPATGLGLPARRARELALQQVWVAVAGEALSRNAHARGIVRGVLEIEAVDPRWRDALAPLLPQLAARLAVLEPGLGVKKFRLRLGGSPDAVEAQLVPEFVGDDPAPRRPPPRRSTTPLREDRPGSEDLAGRLERLAERYVRRVGRQKA